MLQQKAWQRHFGTSLPTEFYIPFPFIWLSGTLCLNYMPFIAHLYCTVYCAEPQWKLLIFSRVISLVHLTSSYQISG
jgi:hypothetical protein